MITVVIRDNGEPNVIKLTYENVWREIKNIPDADIVVAKDWFDALDTKNKLISFIEPDCLLSSGYYESLTGHLKKNPQMGHMAVLSSSTAVNQWASRFFGYNIGSTYSDGIVPNLDKKATSLPFYTIQVAYIPGAVIRTKMIKEILKDMKINGQDMNLVQMSTLLSLAFWRKKWMVYIAPATTYCTTEDYVNDITKFKHEADDLFDKFKAESI